MGAIDPVQLAAWARGEWFGGLPRRVSGISNDSRKLGEGDLFVALASERRDGHDFLEAACAAGAAGAIVERVNEKIPLPQLRVAAVGEAIQAMAAGFRSTWGFPVIGITGSAGKTTCKDLLRLLLGADRTLGTQGNFNNLVGVPISVLRPVPEDTKFAVLEAGINEPGEMLRLARMIDPDLVVFTSIGASHLEGLGSVQAIAREKGQLARGERAKVVYAGASCQPFAGDLGGSGIRWAREVSSPQLNGEYAIERHGERVSLAIRVDGKLEEYSFRGTTKSFAQNVALAISVARWLCQEPGSVQMRLSEWRPSPLRGEWRQYPRFRVYLDCYNANPISMRDAIEGFDAATQQTLRRLFVLGSMEELGKESARYHEELGAYLPLRKEDLLLVVGSQKESVRKGLIEAGKSIDNCIEIEDVAMARRYVERFVGDVFLKGSRKYRLESILEGEGRPC